MKYSFKCDYSEGAHPRIIKALKESNLIQEPGYGKDSASIKATELIRQKINQVDADVHFVSGGTQANIIALSSMLKSYESVISAETGHINVHEAGAIEATGHKIEAIKSTNGKIEPKAIKNLVSLHEDEHMTKPRAVFISNSTEIGTHYSKQELMSLSALCKQNDLYLYLDGARIGSALMAAGAHLSLEEVAKLVDIFYIGGTKNGAFLGEALVVLNNSLKDSFRRHIKQRGGLLAKGRIMGVQFKELFKDDLYFDLAKHSNKMAAELRRGIAELGYEFLTDSRTNQIFPIFPDDLIKKLEKDYGFYVWSQTSNSRSCIRLVTSWATTEKAVASFLNDLRKST